MTLSVTRRGRSPWSVEARTLGLLLAVSVVAPGCITGVPARRLPRELLGETRADTVPIDHLRLRQDPPPAHILQARDTVSYTHLTLPTILRV